MTVTGSKLVLNFNPVALLSANLLSFTLVAKLDSLRGVNFVKTGYYFQPLDQRNLRHLQS